jgi:hypothetical protein
MAREAIDEVNRHAVRTLNVATQTSGVMLQGLQEVAREMLSWQQEVMKHVYSTALMSLQTNVSREPLQRSFEGTRRIGEILIRMSEEAQRAVENAGSGQETLDRRANDERQTNGRGSPGSRAA